MADTTAVIGTYYRSLDGKTIHLAPCPSLGRAVHWSYADGMGLREVAATVHGIEWMRLCKRCWPAAALEPEAEPTAQRALLTLSHRTQCDGSGHAAPIGFDTDEPEYRCHGESAHPDAVSEQCMCGHVPYLTCPDWLRVHTVTEACGAGRHARCDRRAAVAYFDGEVWEGDACPCDCHAVPVSDRAERGTNG